MTQCLTQNSRIAAGLKESYTILNFSGNTSPVTQTPLPLPTPIPMSTAHQSALVFKLAVWLLSTWVEFNFGVFLEINEMTPHKFWASSLAWMQHSL